MLTRTYSYSNVDMLIASKTIIRNMSRNLSELSIIRTSWNERYVAGLRTKVDLIIDNYLGFDKLQALSGVTAYLSTILQPVLSSLSNIKTQIEVDFGDEANEILNNLGFSKNFRAVQKGDHEALIELIYTFDEGLNDELRRKITEKGTNPELIDLIISYASEMKQTNLTQECMKQDRQMVPQETQIILNDIYTEVIGICKIASKFYQRESLKKEQFSFRKVIKKMGTIPKKNKEPILEYVRI